MRLAYKITGGLALFLIVAVLSLGQLLKHNSACEPAPSIAEPSVLMQAIMARCYGSPDVLTLESVPRPAIAANDVLVKVQAASVNPLDWHFMRGSPYLMRLVSGIGTPDDVRVGVDFAGTVEAVGEAVTQFAPGDKVFGGRGGAFAEYLVVPEDRAVALMPTNASFAQAAAIPIAAVSALQALRDKGQLQSGQSVLINGASGGVGTYAVQIAKAFGAEVTGVCSTRNLEMVRSIGADHVIDYTAQDYTQAGKQYDLIIDNVGNHSLLDNRRAMAPEGILVMLGGSGEGMEVLVDPVLAMLLSPFVGQHFAGFLGQLNQADLVILAELMQVGKLTSVIDRSYPLSEVAAAIGYSEQGRARGKIIISVP